MSALVEVPTVPEPQAEEPHGRRTSARSVLATVLLVAFAALALYATVVPLVLQRSGTQLVTITSGSMTPLYPVGSTIRIHPVPDPASVEVGSVITFRSLGNGTVITHRVVQRVERAELGQVHYQTKGDANEAADPDLAPASNIIGVSDGVIPAWQSLAVSLQTPLGRLIAYGGLFVVIALGEIGEIVSAARRKDAA